MSLINRSTRLLLAVCAISLIVAPSRASGQGTTGTISGVVSDSSGTPVVGARVSVDGLNLATSSGQTGRYTLTNVPAGTQTVRARLLGYRLTQQQTTVIAGQAATVNLRLNIAPAELERVVVSTGYGEQTKANVTGASEVVAGEEITKRPVANITKGLQGFMPGVTVQDFGGRPGSDGATVRIRGAGTLGNNGALIIVDGVVGEINNLERARHRERVGAQGRGVGGDLRRARGERRRDHQDAARPEHREPQVHVRRLHRAAGSAGHAPARRHPHRAQHGELGLHQLGAGGEVQRRASSTAPSPASIRSSIPTRTGSA